MSMEEAFRWLASWVAVDEKHGAGGRPSGGTVRNSDFKEGISRDARSALHDFDLWKMGASASFVRLAGVSGALAIGFGAYGAHGIRGNPDMPRERVLAFDAGNRYHLIHSAALLASPIAKYPLLTGTLFASGMLLFSGTCYYFALTGRDDIRRLTPIGGVVLMLAWLSLVA